MKNYFYAFLVIVLLPIFCNGQTANKYTILFIVKIGENGKEIRTPYLMVTSDEMEMGTFKAYQKKDLPQQYGTVTEDEIMVVTLKPTVKLLSIDDLLHKFHIDKQYKSLPIIADDRLISDVSKMLINEAAVRSVRLSANNDTLIIVSPGHYNTLQSMKNYHPIHADPIIIKHTKNN